MSLMFFRDQYQHFQARRHERKILTEVIGERCKELDKALLRRLVKHILKCPSGHSIMLTLRARGYSSWAENALMERLTEKINKAIAQAGKRLDAMPLK